MITINEHTTKTFEEKKSKFIAHLFMYKDFDTIMHSLKEEHPKARHFVYAFRHINEFDQIVEGSSDDGEPKGTSGKPSLNVLGGNELINIGVIIVRYFGGTKLGTGGLVRAYSQAVNDVIKENECVEYKKIDSLELCVLYSNLSKLEYLASKEDVELEKVEFLSESVKVLLHAPFANLEILKQKAKDII